jgi:hypothetical protein
VDSPAPANGIVGASASLRLVDEATKCRFADSSIPNRENSYSSMMMSAKILKFNDPKMNETKANAAHQAEANRRGATGEVKHVWHDVESNPQQ